MASIQRKSNPQPRLVVSDVFSAAVLKLNRPQVVWWTEEVLSATLSGRLREPQSVPKVHTAVHAAMSHSN